MTKRDPPGPSRAPSKPDLHAQVAGCEAEIQKLRAEVDALHADADTLRGDVATLRNELALAKASMRKLPPPLPAQNWDDVITVDEKEVILGSIRPPQRR
jgi:hypothetical protein